MKQKSRDFVVFLINIYQKALSPDKGFLKKFGITRGMVCVFYPSCSEYTKEAVIKYGVFRGVYLGFLRILRCHPWQKNHIDPVVSFDDARSAPKKASSKSTNRVDPLK
jgi:hypothetical protein